MPNLTEKEKRRRTPWFFIFLLLVNFGLMAYDARDPDTKQRVVRTWIQALATPVQQLATNVSTTGFDVFSYVGSLRGAAQENEALRDRVSTLERELLTKQDLADENDRLRGMLALKEENPSRLVAAEVIGRDPNMWFDALLINRGTLAGIELNMPVVTKDGLVGRVVAVTPVSSQIALLSDDKSSVGAVAGAVGVSNAIGTVRGVGGKGILEMRYVPGSETVNVGDVVVTTGQDGIYPPNLKVGEVVEVQSGSATTPQIIFITQSAHPSELREVGVILYRAPERPQPEKTLPNVTPIQNKNKETAEKAKK